MRSAFEDLSARARIRDVALRLIAERGAAGATIRAIAAEAGVSPGLVQHHFGSKQGLRAACDAYIVEALREEARQAVDERRVEDPAFVESAYRTGPLINRYLVRVLLDDSPAAASLFDEIVRLTERYMPPAEAGGEADVRTHAAVFAAMKLGVSVFEGHLLRVMGVRDLAREGYPRIASAVLDIVSPRFVGVGLAARSRAGLDRYQRTRSTDRLGDEEERSHG